MRARPLPALTGLRFVAAAAVVAFHTTQPHIAGAPRIVRDLVANGFVGVSLFFVLSGFILVHVYAGEGRAPAIDRLAFWRARFARVYPAYAVALLFALPVFIARRHEFEPLWASVLSAPLLLQSWHPHTACAWNCPGWSLSAEAFFYAMFPFLIAPLARLSVRALRWVGLAAIAAALLPPLAYALLAPHGMSGVETASPWLHVVMYDPALRLPEFVIGMVAGCLWARGAMPRLPAGAVLLAIVAVLALGDRLPFVLRVSGLLTPLFALLVVALADARGLAARALSTGLMIELGEASYALYLVHVPLHAYWDRTLHAFGLDIRTETALYVAYLASAVLLALGVRRFVEEPARRWVRAWTATRRPALAPAPAVVAPAVVAPAVVLTPEFGTPVWTDGSGFRVIPE